MTRSLDNDEKGTQIVSTLGGNQEMMVITQSGCFFHTALKTRVEKAREFKQVGDRRVMTGGVSWYGILKHLLTVRLTKIGCFRGSINITIW